MDEAQEDKCPFLGCLTGCANSVLHKKLTSNFHLGFFPGDGFILNGRPLTIISAETPDHGVQKTICLVGDRITPHRWALASLRKIKWFYRDCVSVAQCNSRRRSDIV